PRRRAIRARSAPRCRRACASSWRRAGGLFAELLAEALQHLVGDVDARARVDDRARHDDVVALLARERDDGVVDLAPALVELLVAARLEIVAHRFAVPLDRAVERVDLALQSVGVGRRHRRAFALLALAKIIEPLFVGLERGVARLELLRELLAARDDLRCV